MNVFEDSRQPLRVLGTMSGTSMDGIDAAILETDGHKIIDFGPTYFRAYSNEEQATIRAALGLWRGIEVEKAEATVLAAHLDVLQRFEDIDLIGFHGQTIAHEPRTRGTLQLGNGSVIAQTMGIPTVWDFRSADIAYGGEGAPLAPFFHFACSKWIAASEPLCFLNLGGVGNITFVDPCCAVPDVTGALLAFDTGPANAPLDDLMQLRRGAKMDHGGSLAKRGKARSDVIDVIMAEDYFSRHPPKSLDRGDFAQMLESVAKLNDADALATMTAVCAKAVESAFQYFPSLPSNVLVTGGGRRNLTLLHRLQDACRVPVKTVDSVGLDGNMLEAQAFAFLAARVVQGLPTSSPETTGARTAVCGGTLEFPP
ncbi:MAG: anhydro-N-acetylmuramic acid kinase [Aestuariivita sp.]|nr:anhydro-N-acetylmuramic acid kinase [Aestuariivita sp.]MCY4347507.1 anhydro-N-acetylmuramic acid kinase [Aestuariivita sp.]